MAGDYGERRYFVYLNLFVAGMLIFVLADNLVLIYLGWEVMGLCSYALVSHWYRKATLRLVRAQGLRGHAHRRHRAGAGDLPDLRALPYGRSARPVRGAAGAAGRYHDARLDRAAGADRCGRQVGAAAAVDLAARCHGRPQHRLGTDSCRDHGDRGRVFDPAPASVVRAGAARCCGWSARGRRADAGVCGDGGVGPVRHQARDRLFDHQSDRLHVPGARHRRLRPGAVPSRGTRLLQVAAVHVRRRGDRALRRRPRHPAHGRPGQARALSAPGVPGGRARPWRRCRL